MTRKDWRTLLLCALLLPSGLLQSGAGPNRYTPPSSNPEHLHTFGDHVYFSADDGIHGRELWRVDIAGNAELVKDITPGPAGTRIDHFHAFQGHLYFRAGGGGGARELWRTDGSAGGTAPISRFGEQGESNGITFIAGHNGTRLFFGVGPDVDGGTSELWCSDGTPAGTAPLAMDGASSTLVMEEYHGAMHAGAHFFGARTANASFGLWRSDGTPAGTHLILPLAELPTSVVPLDEERFVFVGDDGSTGRELWVSGGTPETTHFLKDIYPGLETSDAGDPVRLVEPEGPARVLFAATHPESGRELWETDGTVEGTRLLADIFSGAGSSNPYHMTQMGDDVYIVATGEGLGKELWRYSLKSGSVTLAMDINPGIPGSDPYAFAKVSGSLLYFSALDDTHGEELWVIEIGKSGPELAADIFPGKESSFPYYTAALHDRGVTVATSPVFGRELWITDRKYDGIDLLADIFTDASANPSSHPGQMTPAGDYLFFTANDIEHGNELWRSDGTAGGTVMVRDIFPGSASSNPESLIALGGLLYFSADDGLHGSELWRSDGTHEGTAMEMDIHPDGDARPRHLTVLKDVLIFSAFRPLDGEELWILEPGKLPKLLKNIAEGDRSSSPSEFVVWKEHAYFQADNGIHGRELWRTDGTSEGTVLVRDILSAPFEGISLGHPREHHGVLYFAADMGGLGTELWALDESGTRIEAVADIATPAIFDVRARDRSADDPE